MFFNSEKPYTGQVDLGNPADKLYQESECQVSEIVIVCRTGNAIYKESPKLRSASDRVIN